MNTLHDRDADYFRAILDDAASHRELTVVERELRAVLAETTTTQPGCGWCDDGRDVTHPNCDHAAAQPVESETDEREARAWKDAWREYVGPNTMSDLAVRTHAHRAGFAAGFRRSRPEAS